MIFPDSYHSSSRVWIYQANRHFTEEEVGSLRSSVKQFAGQWVAHNRALKADGDVVFDKFIVLLVDESQAPVSGCSIDSSVSFIKAIEQEYNVDLFDRMLLAYQEGDRILALPRDQFATYFAENKITKDTLVVDTLVSSKDQLDQGFLKPLKDSWHLRLV